MIVYCVGLHSVGAVNLHIKCSPWSAIDILDRVCQQQSSWRCRMVLRLKCVHPIICLQMHLQFCELCKACMPPSHSSYILSKTSDQNLLMFGSICWCSEEAACACTWVQQTQLPEVMVHSFHAMYQASSQLPQHTCEMDPADASGCAEVCACCLSSPACGSCKRST